MLAYNCITSSSNVWMWHCSSPDEYGKYALCPRYLSQQFSNAFEMSIKKKQNPLYQYQYQCNAALQFSTGHWTQQRHRALADTHCTSPLTPWAPPSPQFLSGLAPIQANLFSYSIHIRNCARHADILFRISVPDNTWPLPVTESHYHHVHWTIGLSDDRSDVVGCKKGLYSFFYHLHVLHEPQANRDSSECKSQQ